ncbi:MAG: VCBS repeat-containing protein [Phycisphaeraceae bacterium]
MRLTSGFSCTAIVSASITGLVLAMAAEPAPALINPDFTPMQLLHQAQRVIAMELKPGEDGQWTVRVAEAVKGDDADDRPVAFDLTALHERDRDEVERALGQWRTEPGLLFLGEFSDAGGDTAGAGLLHVGGQWLSVNTAAPGQPWPIEALDPNMQAVWNGGTDMLHRALRYIQTNPFPDVPVQAGARWGEPIEVATVAPPVHSAQAVDLEGDGRLAMVLLNSAAGDRLLRWDEGQQTLIDITADLGLQSKSRAAACGDFTGNGRLDLASANSDGITLWQQAEDGTFTASDADLAHDGSAVLGLAAMDVDGGSGAAGLLVSTDSVPQLITRTGQSDYQSRPITAIDPDPALGQAHAALVADFTGDGVADVLQPFAEGARLFPGVAPGDFDKPQSLDGLTLGDEPTQAIVADFDHDGRFDVYFAGDAGSFFWHNAGDGQFRERLNLTGEVSYHTRANSVAPVLCDLNADGRQDLTILYRHQGPQYFFNRGFHSFGFAIDFDPMDVLADLGQGQQAGVAADFTGDGAQELAMVLNDGTLWLMRRDVDDVPGLAVRAALPATADLTGPLRVTAEYDERSLGAWSVTAGAGEAYFGLPMAGPVVLRWQTPDGEWHEQEVVAERGAVHVELTP